MRLITITILLISTIWPVECALTSLQQQKSEITSLLIAETPRKRSRNNGEENENALSLSSSLSLHVASTFSTTNVVWVQGLVGQSCTSACLNIYSSCASAGPWPVQYSDFYAVLSLSYDLSSCSSPSKYGTCQHSWCSAVGQGTFSYSGSYGSVCYYGGGSSSTCGALPYSGHRRFCPCVQSTIGTITAAPSVNPTASPSGPTVTPSFRPSKPPTLSPTFFPSLSPSYTFSTAGVVWVQGGVGQSCTTTCLSLLASCSSSGPWPLQAADFYSVLSVSYDLTSSSCTASNYQTCQHSFCPFIFQGNATYASDPEGGTSNCFYGGGHGTCNSVPDGWNRRFCPCIQSSIGKISPPPSAKPSNSPLTSPTRSPASIPTTSKQPVAYTVSPTLDPATPAVVWVQGGVGQSCSAACLSIGASCSTSGPWPVQYSDFMSLLSVSYDLTTCTPSASTYQTCQHSVCSYIQQDTNTYASDPEGDSYYTACYYGGGYANSCTALPDRNYRRFCPCLKSSIGTLTYSPSSTPTQAPSSPTPVPTLFPTRAPKPPTYSPTFAPNLPALLPTLPPSLSPAYQFSTTGVTWVQGSWAQSCTAACKSISGTCSASGPWPLQFSDFMYMLSVSYDLTTCSPSKYQSCQKSICTYITMDSKTYSQDPEGDTWFSTCYYGGGYVSTCDALPDAPDFRRFCPCVNVPTSSPTLIPTPKPTPLPTSSPAH